MKQKMSRRQFAALAAGGLTLPALAHHGWSSFDANTPLYLQGKATTVKWRNPHVELNLQIAADLQLPADLAQRSVPAQTAGIDGSALLRRTQLPVQKQAVWEIELAPLTRMEAWKIAEFPAGTELAVVGYGLADLKARAVLRAEYLWVSGKVYALRSSPVG